jgi:hypothetical protein
MGKSPSTKERETEGIGKWEETGRGQGKCERETGRGLGK